MSAVLTLVPMTRPVARLWHQLQALMLKEAHGLEVVPSGAIVLPGLPADAPYRFHRHDSDEMLTIGDVRHNYDVFTKRWVCPKGWDIAWWSQAHWRLSVYRTDAAGREFSCSGGVYVMDDFGYLVEVSQ